MFSGFMCKKEGSLKVKYFKGYETRNESTVRMIELAIQKYQISDFDWVVVHTGDREGPKEYDGKRVLGYATKSQCFDNVCPDFTFDHWRQTQMEDYEATRKELVEAGGKPPQTGLLGWRGNVSTHPSRKKIVKLDDKINFDVEGIVWNRKDPSRLICPNYVSLVDQVSRWRYLIDIEGVGWSARLKLLFFSRRVVFVQDRPFKEWYFPRLNAWEHFVPVKRNLSDLVEKLNLVKDDQNLEDSLRNKACDFACNYLTRDAALERWYELLTAAQI